MKHTFIFLVALVLATACEDFLEETPETIQTPTNFYENEEQINEAVAAIYFTNRGIHEDLQWRFGEMRSDNTSFQYNPSDRGGFENEAVDLFVMTTSNGNLVGYWNQAYSGISRANFVLESLEDAAFVNEENRQLRRAEALFLRSWFYFNLVRLYGPVPYVTSAANSPEEALSDEFTERIPVDQVYQSILVDVQEAIDILPAQWDAANVGRATRGAALMLMAKMHMAQQQYNEAIPLLEEMGTLGYSLLPNYGSVFDPSNKNNAESVFEIQYSFALGQGSNFISRFVPWNSGSDILGESGPAGTRAGQNQPTEDLIALYDEEDPRFSFNISFYEDPTGVEPWISKYAFAFVDVGIQDVNWLMFRYADALLMLAECYNEVNGLDTRAVDILEQIRTRAGLPDPTVSVADADALRQFIADERRRELAFENHRWFDLLRYGTAVEVMSAHGEAQNAQKPSNVPGAYANIRTTLGVPLGAVEQFEFEQTPGWEGGEGE